jgi:hypothetical protein
MEADISQIKTLLWVIISLLAIFISMNVLCKILGCGEHKKIDYADLLGRGQIKEVIDKARSRLKTHPRDVDALYYQAKALFAYDRFEEARVEFNRLAEIEPLMRKTCKDWLDIINENTDKEDRREIQSLDCMKEIFLVHVKASPDGVLKSHEEFGGAYINVYTTELNIRNALDIAEREVEKAGWHTMRVIYANSITAENFADDDSGLEHYEKALQDELVVTVHTFPPQNVESESLN